MRGTYHEKGIREYTIDSKGMHIKRPFYGVQGIISGAPTYNYSDERERLGDMFRDTD